jgi:acetyltransferase-like isoleucine patch superfamily enzyme
MAEHDPTHPTPHDLTAYAAVTFDGSVFLGSHCVLGFPKEATIRRHLAEGIAVSELAKPVRIGTGCIIGNHVVIHEGTSIGADSVIDDRTRIGYDARLGARTRLTYGSFICDQVSIGDDARIGGFVCDGAHIGEGATVMGALVHEYTSPHVDWWSPAEAAPTIEAEAVIGYHATVVGDVQIGQRAYIAAGAIVTRDVPAEHVVTGVNEHVSLRAWKGKRLQVLRDHWLRRKKDGYLEPDQ